MIVQQLMDIVLGLALVAFIAYRQTTWRYLDPARIWRAPLVFAAIGVVLLIQNSGTSPVTATDIVFLGIEALVSIGVGLAMGSMTRFRTAPTPDSRGLSLQTRTGIAGAALWLVIIATRIGIGVLGAHFGAHLLETTGPILLMLGVNRAARALMVDQRMPQAHRARA